MFSSATFSLETNHSSLQTFKDITNEFRELLAFDIKGGGLGIRNPMMVAEEFYNTSLNCCNYLV